MIDEDDVAPVLPEDLVKELLIKVIDKSLCKKFTVEKIWTDKYGRKVTETVTVDNTLDHEGIKITVERDCIRKSD